MKSISLVMGMALIICLDSCSQDLRKLSESEVDEHKVQIAHDFALNYLTQLKEGGFYEFRDEVIEVLKTQLTEENQKAGYRQLKDQFGDFEGLEYAETWVQGNNDSIQIFRFKSDFDKSNKKLEVRVVLDASEKIAGLWIKPWSDMLN